MMKITHQHIILTLTLALALTACSKQNWYQGMQSAQTADCMKGPASEYDDCNKQSDETYNDYQKSREDLTKDPSHPE